jgi:ParB family chromosome partitioning protein
MTLQGEDAVTRLAGKIVERKMSVRDAERLARQQNKKPKSSTEQTPAERDVEERLRRSLGTKVRLKHRRGKGRIEIHFHSLDHLNALLEQIAP